MQFSACGLDMYRRGISCALRDDRNLHGFPNHLSTERILAQGAVPWQAHSPLYLNIQYRLTYGCHLGGLLSARGSASAFPVCAFAAVIGIAKCKYSARFLALFKPTIQSKTPLR